MSETRFRCVGKWTSPGNATFAVYGQGSGTEGAGGTVIGPVAGSGTSGTAGAGGAEGRPWPACAGASTPACAGPSTDAPAFTVPSEPTVAPAPAEAAPASAPAA